MVSVKKRSIILATACTAALVGAFAGSSQAEMEPTLNFSGVPGLIDMPSGEALADGRFTLSVANFGPITRSTLSFQINPWLSGSFRLSNTADWRNAPQHADDFYSSYNDRSFDLRFRLLQESTYLPAVSLGLQDFVGTGLYSGEYLAATKTFAGKVKVTGGLGWGRFGSYKPFGAPFGSRPPVFGTESDGFGSGEFGYGGKPSASSWFKGDAALFGGVEWQITDKWTAKAEYSSDAYLVESVDRETFERDSPFNFGVEYQANEYMRLGLYSLYGSEVGLSFHMVLDPKTRANGGVSGPAPIAVGSRPSRAADPEAYDQGWVTQGDAAPILRKNLIKILERDGIRIEDLSYTATRVQIRIRNSGIDAGAQAIGRTARALSQVMPASVETFEIVPVTRGIAASKVTIRRSDLETLEHVADNDSRLRERVVFSDAIPLVDGIGPEDGLYPKFRWRVLPGYRVSAPARGDLGLRATASYDLAPGLVFSGTAYGQLLENHDKVRTLDKGGTLPHVRSDVREYNQDSSLSMERLTMSWYKHPAQNIYTRATLGYLERMHGGLSGEVLWKRVDRPFALGVELNYTKQRDTDGGFGFGDYDYSIVTGYLSAYYDFGNGYLGQLDVGRYLAGDVGATLSVDREFANGWRVGAFATLTDASAEEFGEGSFDKGIRLSIPLNWVLGSPSRQTISETIRPLQRDGGARVDVEGRLYDTIREYHTDRLDDQWGRVWR